MRFEPPVDHSRLIETIRQAYGISVEKLTFVPASSSAACYAVTSGSDAPYFLKVWPRPGAGQPAAAQNTSLAVTRALYDCGSGLRIPYPLLTLDGALWAELAGAPLALAPFLPGRRPAEPWSPAFCAELGRTVACIHRATPLLTDVLIPQETLDVPVEPLLRRNLESAMQFGPGSRPGLAHLREWVGVRQDEIGAQLDRLHRLQEAAREVAGPLVLCHTDLHHNNLLVEDEGPIGIVDWDDVKIAPPEHNLWAGLGRDYRGESFGAFIDAYRSSGAAEALCLEHFAFYLLRRYLEDANFNLTGMLDKDADEREDSVRLQGLEECFDRWSRLDETLAAISYALR